jgi:hypothetical protein
MEADHQLSEKESLQIINEMIGKAKRSYVTKGIASMVWGLMIIVCSLVTWSQIKYKWNAGFDVWMLLFVAIFPQIYFSVKEKRQKKFTGHDDNIVNHVWIAFAIAILITGFYNSKFGTKESTTIILILYGIPTFIMGGLFKFKPMIFGGLICWLFSIISVYTMPDVDMLLMAGCGFFAWLIPGVILWKRYKMQHHKNV